MEFECVATQRKVRVSYNDSTRSAAMQQAQELCFAPGAKVHLSFNPRQVSNRTLDYLSGWLSSCGSIEYLYVSGYYAGESDSSSALCTCLAALQCSAPRLLKIDVGNCSVLSEDVKAMESVCVLIERATGLKELVFPVGDITDAEPQERPVSLMSSTVERLELVAGNLTLLGDAATPDLHLASCIGKFPRLKYVGLDHYGRRMAAFLERLLSTTSTIESLRTAGKLDLDQPVSCPVALWNAIASNSSLVEVDCEGVEPSNTAGCEAMRKALAAHPNLRALTLRKIGDDYEAEGCIQAVKDGLESNPRAKLRDLIIDHYYPRNEDKALEGLAGRLPSIQSLKVQLPRVQSIQALANGLRSTSSRLECIEAFGTQVLPIDPAIHEQLAEGLQACPSLKRVSLTMEYHPAEYKRAAYIAALRSSTIEHIELGGYEEFTLADTTVAFGQAAANDTVTYLDLGYMEDHHAPLYRLLTQNVSLNHIRCYSGAFSPEGGQAGRFLQALGMNRGLCSIKIDLGRRPVEVGHVCYMLKSNVTLHSVEIRGFALKEDERAELIACIGEHCPGLKQLHMPSISDTETSRLVRAAVQSDRSDVVHEWMKYDPRAERAACLLRLLANPELCRSLDQPAAMEYCARALGLAVEADNPADAILVSQALLDLAGVSRIEDNGVAMPVEVDCLTPMLSCGPSAGSQQALRLIQGCNMYVHAGQVAKGRYGLRRDDAGGRWAGAAKRCQEFLEASVGWRRDRLLQWRRAVEAKRDASMMFRAARDGRPLELGKRLRLGKLAGGLDAKHSMEHDGASILVTAREAALTKGHLECAELIREADER